MNSLVMLPHGLSAESVRIPELPEESLSDEQFLTATDLLSARFDRRSLHGDPRTDDPQLIFDWFRHAHSRLPDFRVWLLGCSIENFFDPFLGPHLRHGWREDVRQDALDLNEHPRSRP